ncbi:MAG: LptF/LptG family permease [Planctomycetes bacterium]|nr:LptF/LptG family permease [Planctomycetota bacterium]
MLRFFRAYVLQRYVLVEFLKNFGIAILVCGLLMLLGTVVRQASEYENYGISSGQVAWLAPYFLPQAMAYAIPLAVMIAAIMAFGRMAAENEILAAQSGGASIGKVSVWVVVVSVFLCFAVLWCNDQGIEWGFGCIRDNIINYSNPAFRENLEKPGSSLSMQLEQGTSVTINLLPRRKDEATGRELRPVHVAYFSNDRTVQSFFAKDHVNGQPSANDHGGVSMKITLLDCQSTNSDAAANISKEIALVMDLPPLDTTFSLGNTAGTEGYMTNLRMAEEMRKQIRTMQLGTLDRAAETAAQVAARSPADPVAPLAIAAEWMETRQGSETIGSLREKSLRRIVEFHRKLSISWIPFSMVFLGIGLGLLVKKGQRMVGFVLGLLTYFVVYYPLMITFKQLANSSALPPWSLWMPNLLVLLLGLWLWRLHNRGLEFGWMANVVPLIVNAALWAWRPIAALNLGRLTPFRRRADQHVVQGFLTPMLAVSLAVGVFIVSLDLFEHGNDVVKGVMKADQPLAGPARTIPEALLDVGIYYGIRALSLLFDLMPILILIAGGMAVAVMVRNNEHLIFKAAGTRLQRVFMPMLLIAAMLSIGVTAVRESVMPNLLMEVDYLKPLVYHRSAKTLSMAGQTRDAENRNVVYEMGSYNRNKHECNFLRVYRTDEEDLVNGRVVRVSADKAVWNQAQDCWDLKTEILEAANPNKAAKKKKPEAGGEQDSKAAVREVKYTDAGKIITPERTPDPLGQIENRFAIAKLDAWRGTMSPSFLDSESLGPGVVRLGDLWAMRDNKPHFRSELWRRAFEWVSGILLLMVSIPLLVKQEVRSILVSVVKCVLLGALYFALLIVVSELAHQQILPSWAPVLPHAFFLLLAVWQYMARMQT